jgi:uncharacterized RDD family membrane protein YckC
LDARIAAAPTWVQAEHAGDELILAVNPDRIGTLAGEVVVESQARSVSVRVTAQVDPPMMRAAESAPADRGQHIAGKESPPLVTARSSAGSSPAPTDATPSRRGADERGHYQEHALATWPRRLLARMIDLVPLLIVLLVTRNVIGLVIAVLIDLYNRGYLGGAKGQSWGQRALHLRLVRMTDEQPIGLLAAMVRELAYLLIVLLFAIGVGIVIGLISWGFAIWDARRQTLGDRLMHTVVLTEGPTAPSSSQVPASSQPR